MSEENKNTKDSKSDNQKTPVGKKVEAVKKSVSKVQNKKIETKTKEVSKISNEQESKTEVPKNKANDTAKNIEVKEASKDKTKKKTLTSSQTPVNAKQKKLNDSSIKASDSKQNSQESLNRNNEQGEYVEKLVSINRVAKVVKGGRRFSFAALVVVGDGNGMVGHGKGKAKEVPEAIKKATDEAKNTMIRVPLRQGRTLHHDIQGRFDSGKVYLRSAPSGTGVIAGGPMRAVFEALGIQDIVAKSVGTSNPHNMVRATFEALKSASSPKIIAMRRGLKINDITKRRKNAQIGNENVKN